MVVFDKVAICKNIFTYFDQVHLIFLGPDQEVVRRHTYTSMMGRLTRRRSQSSTFSGTAAAVTAASSAAFSPLVLHALLVTLLSVATTCSGSVSHCPDNHYLTRDTHECQACSMCPKNQIIRVPCSKHRDTVCGPFFEFHEFHQGSRPKVNVDDLTMPDVDVDIEIMGPRRRKHGGNGDDSDSSESSLDRIEDILKTLDEDPMDPHLLDTNRHDKHSSSSSSPRQKHHHSRDGGPARSSNSGGQIEVFPDVREKPSGRKNHLISNGRHRGRGRGRGGDGDGVASTGLRPRYQDDRNNVPSMQNQEGEESQWKVLALALIVVLCVVCLFLIVFVFVVCYMRSRRAHVKKVLYSADHGPTARSLGMSYTSGHYVPVLTHAQGRTGTSGAGGGATNAPPCGMVDSSYLYSDDYDDDNSGQTISTTKSSDYVYFKTPHNGGAIYDL